MGNGHGRVRRTNEAKSSAKIDSYLKAEAKKMDNGDHKLLLLGPGSTGKSTLFKSLRCSKVGGVTDFTLSQTVPIIRCEIIDGIRKLLAQSAILYQNDPVQHYECKLEIYKETDEKHRDNSDMPDKITCNTIMNFDVQNKIKDLRKKYKRDDVEIWKELNKLAKYIDCCWKLPCIQATFRKRGTNFNFEDNVDYFLDHVLEVFEKDYSPTEQDYLRARQRTAGKLNSNFKF